MPKAATEETALSIVLVDLPLMEDPQFGGQKEQMFCDSLGR
jgi:hypothetical protein